MYIKSIKTQGFKSFADKLELDLTPGICNIVGPNGSGKSNVVDAILWVLGEQSVKQLRGDAGMTDVIFSGSKTRDALSKASVAILFDNSDHVLKTEYNEVEIKRVIYRTGENEYYINNVRVRLKDISDLFIDVTSKFNIISQGNINALVENKSSERRSLFESAAGVLKYKKRKEEALKKLDGTKENLTRVNLIINELNTTLEPLEKEKEVASKYLNIKKELESMEVSLIASDITTSKEKLDKLENENKNLQKELDSSPLIDSNNLEEIKTQSIKLDEEITTISNQLLDLSNEISGLNSQKQINVERAKLNVDKKTVDANLLKLNEEKLDYERKIEVLSSEILSLKSDFTKMTKEYNELSDKSLKLKITLSNNNVDLNNVKRDIFELQSKIKIEQNNLDNNAYLPKSISSVISNPRLKGIHNTINNLINVNEAHQIAISTSLGASGNFIITDSLEDSKKAIRYLKENNLGRATFFPLDTIKSRKIDNRIENEIKSYPGYIGIASDLITFNEDYRSVIENQLGNVIIVDSLDDLTFISHKLDHKYKIVSLEGDVIYPGGSISGGTINQSLDKSIINKLKSELASKNELLDTITFTLNNNEKDYNFFNEKLTEINKKLTDTRLIIESKEWTLMENNEKHDAINSDIKGLNDLNNSSLDKSIAEIIEKVNKKITEKDICESKLRDLQSKRFDINNNIEVLEHAHNELLVNQRKMENAIKDNNVEIAKYEVKMDNLLNILTNDYNLTYDYALNNYSLDIDESIARTRVSKLKSELKDLTDVNIGSISEYDRLKKRYDFLNKQKEDLMTSSDEMMNIISEMDEIMKEKFKDSFDKIAAEFSKVFREMFKGGNGILKLQNKDDLLNTNIDILAIPPGKKLNSTAALSGGEKALTAICLIFAILNVKPAPFVVLDEVEAPLDEENVNMFGDYLSNMKKQSQFILITHKKKMMEYADILYGITMQESGVSKLVSVKLEGM